MHKKIQEFIQNDLLFLGESIIQFDDNLFEFGLDSLKLMKLINFLEDQYQLLIPFEQVNPTQLKSINSIVNLLEKINESKENNG